MTGPQQRGRIAEEHAAEKYGFRREHGDWYDGVGASGVRYEVKSGLSSVRFFEKPHDTLTSNGGFYVIVQTTRDGRVRESKRKRATTVTDIIQAAGGWVESGHSRAAGREKYVSMSSLL